MRQVEGLEYIPEVYPKDIGYVVNDLVDRVNQLIEAVELLQLQLIELRKKEV